MATVSEALDNNPSETHAAPPFLRRVRIRGYKSIAFCDVELAPLTVLVGRNASGKSNFLDALAFLRDALRFNVPEAIKLHGGFPAILCRSVNSPALSIEIEASFEDDPGTIAHYALTLPASQGSEPVLPHEGLRFEDVTGKPIRRFEVRQGKAEWWDDGISAQPSRSEYVAPNHLYLGVYRNPQFLELTESLGYMGIHQFHPEAIRRLQRSARGYLLERDGSNLANVIAMLQEKDPDLLERVKRYLTSISPDVQDFNPVRYGEYETIRFRLRSTSASPPLEFDAASMSDGTLRALAALTAAFQVIFPKGRSSVVGIEEPETSLHPAAVRALVDAFDEATTRTQVLITTHSPLLLDNPTITPDSVRVVDLIDGKTVITPIDAASREILRRKLDSLGGLERQNQLEADPEDLRRQEQLARNGREGTA